ncbi:unnamed protein product [Schistocephalus solidus]|uniref:Uncharacterized protein n=1 Tax=Schistocephalus solidus TaxID=70667 RepID=A0A183SYW4_SCHSO|nr:unnamed protein product [Schistocephalus solidus]
MTDKACSLFRPFVVASVTSKTGRNPRKRPRKPPVRRVVAEAYPAEIVPSVDPADASTTLSTLPVLKSASFSAVVSHNCDTTQRASHSEPLFLGSASAVITSNNQEEVSVPTAISPAGRRVKKRRAPSETSEQPVSENEDDRYEAGEDGDEEDEEEEEDDGGDDDDEADGNDNEEMEDDDSDGLSNLRGSKVKFVQIRDHESPVKETLPEGDAMEPARQCYVICQDNCNTRKVRKSSKCHLRITH